MTRQEANGLVLWGVLLGAAFLTDNDTFYTTGKTYYKACYEKQVAAGGHFAEPRAPDPDKAALWAQCEPIALRALRETGMRVDRHAAAARFQGCPDADSEIPLGGLDILVIQQTAALGGPTFLERFTPADMMVRRVLTSTWPNCPHNG